MKPRLLLLLLLLGNYSFSQGTEKDLTVAFLSDGNDTLRTCIAVKPDSSSDFLPETVFNELFLQRQKKRFTITKRLPGLTADSPGSKTETTYNKRWQKISAYSRDEYGTDEYKFHYNKEGLLVSEEESYGGDNFFGHVAFEYVYDKKQRLMLRSEKENGDLVAQDSFFYESRSKIPYSIRSRPFEEITYGDSATTGITMKESFHTGTSIRSNHNLILEQIERYSDNMVITETWTYYPNDTIRTHTRTIFSFNKFLDDSTITFHDSLGKKISSLSYSGRSFLRRLYRESKFTYDSSQRPLTEETVYPEKGKIVRYRYEWK